jgi:hypothetical protein
MDLSTLIPASWRTKLSGIVAGITLLAAQLGTLADSDPKTNPDISVCVFALFVMVGLASARQNNVTSEKAGAK